MYLVCGSVTGKSGLHMQHVLVCVQVKQIWLNLVHVVTLDLRQ